MRSRLQCKIFVVSLLLFLNVSAFCIPDRINYQGRVEVKGSSFTGTGFFRFAIINGTETESYWSNDGTSVGASMPATPVRVDVADGLYNVILGYDDSMLAIPPSVFDQSIELYLRIWFDDGSSGVEQLKPDVQIVSVPYAHVSDITGNADTVDGVHASALEESAEIDSDIATHAANASAHHTKTTSFTELTDMAKDSQIPDDITIDYAANADRVDGVHASTLEESAEIDSDIATHAANSSAHHTKTTSFTELTDSATDAQIPNSITIDYAASAGNADTVDGHHYSSSWEGEWTDLGTYIQANNATPNVVVTDDGKLGIGTTTPDEALTVNGGLLRQGSTAYGTNSDTHVNLGRQSVTGTSGQNYSNAVVGGGWGNLAADDSATVGGGYACTASGVSTTVGGGIGNTASESSSVVAGGYYNDAVASYATVGGGYRNSASWDYATVSGGYYNTATAYYATVAGGSYCTVGGNYSFAAGRRAKTYHMGTFVWADNEDFDFTSTDDKQFLIRAGNGVGIGTASPSNQLHVRDVYSGAPTVYNHAAQIENASAGTSPDVLALKVGYTGNPSSGVNFITFFKGDDVAVGAVDGDGAGGVTLRSGSADFAECLPQLDPQEELLAGDVVGLFEGSVSKRTEGADKVMVVSTRPIVLGNDPGETHDRAMAEVAFMGQADVKVVGSVKRGDFIVPSGKGDGTGKAVTPESLSIGHLAQVVGQAWGDAEGVGVHKVPVSVGFSMHETVATKTAQLLKNLQAENSALKARLSQIEERVDQLAATDSSE